MVGQDERVRRLVLLASALAGRRLEVESAEAGTPTWTDNFTIHLDASLDGVGLVQAVAVQAALVAADSLNPVVISTLRRRDELCARYLAIEGRRALAQLREVLPAAAGALVAAVALPSASASESLELAKAGAPVEAAPMVYGQIRPRRVRFPVPADEPGRVEQTTVRVARTLRELDDGADLDERDRSVADDLSSPVGGGGAIGRLLQRLTTSTRSRDTGPPGADAATRSARQGRSAGRRVGVAAAAGRVRETGRLGPPTAHPYPEWDCHRARYRPDWCTVREREATVGEPVVVHDSRRLRRALGRVMPDRLAVRRQLQGDDIDIDAVVSERVDLAAGITTDEAIYIESVRRRRDLGVLVLLDVSASAGEPSATGASIHHHQRAMAASLALALHGLGDRVAVSAFRSMGRDNVEFVAIKRFSDPADVTVLRRLGGLVPGAYTRLGAAIRHASATLDREAGTPRKLLIVVSDGFAYDHGYEGRYGESDARRALAEARRSGIGCLCLSIGGVTEAESLTRVFGTAAHASLATLEDLPGVVATLFPAALRSADHRRRTWQHRSRSRRRQQLDRRTA